MTFEDPREPAEAIGANADPPAEGLEGAMAADEADTQPSHQRRRSSTLREYLEAFLIAVIFATFARTFVVQAFKIPTGSMEQNLLIGDHILVNKFIYGRTASDWDRALFPHRQIRRGDVVVFKYPEDPTRDFIKRCVALPGDRVELIGQLLYVNGELVEDASYVYYHPHVQFREHFGPVTVPEGEYFCMGDNRDNSRDSRSWGSVPAGYVKGRAFLVYWSYDGGRESLDWPGYRGKIEQLTEVARGFFTRTRWSRSFTIVR